MDISIGEGINKPVSLHNKVLLSHTNTLLVYGTTWMNPQIGGYQKQGEKEYVLYNFIDLKVSVMMGSRWQLS